METTKLFFECENCGQPFDIEIKSGDFKPAKNGGREGKGDAETAREYIYEFKGEFHCCGKSIEIKISVLQYPTGAYNRHDVCFRGLRNLRTDDNFNKIINDVCAENILK
jgi:hypothetical protein